jgi:site-specific DNA-methyltransferase (adenine-specific)
MKNSPITRQPSSVDAAILKAFLEVRGGRSADVVIADPELNAAFIKACKALGLIEPPSKLNRRLYNLRKLRALEDYPTTQRAHFRRQDEYSFAAEIAARYLERHEHTTLDRIICDPKLAAEFDRLARELAPGFSSLEYRFAALSLRKKRALKPEIVARIIEGVQVTRLRVAGLDLQSLPKGQGVYVLYYRKEGVLYVGEAVNLRNRIRQHLEHSDRKLLAHWLWEKGSDDLFVELHLLPENTSTLARKALERELINSRRPKFNISGVDTREA